MKKLLLAGLALSGALALASCGGQPTPVDTDITGTWDMTLLPPAPLESNDVLPLRYELTQQGQKVIGIVSVGTTQTISGFTDYVPFGTVNGTVVGDKVSLNTVVQWSDILSSLNLVGAVSGQKMSGTYTFGFKDGTTSNSGHYSGVKIK